MINIHWLITVCLDLQFTNYCSAPLLLILQPTIAFVSSADVNAQTLPFKAYEPSIEIKERTSRSVFIEVSYKVETGEAERIAVDWTAKGGGSGTSRKCLSADLSSGVCVLIIRPVDSHLQTQRSAVKMLHERIIVLVKYVTDVIAGRPIAVLMFHPHKSQSIQSSGQAPKDQATLRALAALVASLPATESKPFRHEFDTVSPFIVLSDRPAINARSITGI